MSATNRIYLGKDSHKFSAAHMTVFPDGSKERLHGHNFRVQVALDLRDISFAAFIDFAAVKRALQEQCDAWDERVILAARCPLMSIARHDEREIEFTLARRRYVLPADECVLLPVENIVCESLAAELARSLAGRLSAMSRHEVITGLEVDVAESPGQGARHTLLLPSAP